MDDRNPGTRILTSVMKAGKRRSAAAHVQELARGRDDARCGIESRLNSARSIGATSSPLRALRVVLVSLALALAACAPASNSAASSEATTTGEPTSACPFENFDDYIERFAREIAFQELTTADPLVVERYDAAAEPEPRRVVEEVALADVVWPVMPRLDLISGRVYDIAPIADGSMEVQVRTPDTSDQQRYVFGQSPCWQLQRVVDESI